MSKSVSQSVSDIIRYRAAASQLKTRAQNIEFWPKGRHFCDDQNFQKKIQKFDFSFIFEFRAPKWNPGRIQNPDLIGLRPKSCPKFFRFLIMMAPLRDKPNFHFHLGNMHLVHNKLYLLCWNISSVIY